MSFNEKREFELLEKEIPALENERQQLTEQLSNPNLNYIMIEEISNKLLKINSDLEIKEMRWLELSELL
ncbi:MAG: hypothetical protein LC122_11100 [Chitinophagales bacterium]|nr:hypothetical protein [Chitinophagales bacterium]